MKIKNLSLEQGLKKNKKWNVIRSTGAALIIAGMLSTPVYACVPQENIKGDLEYNVDRSAIKLSEANTLDNLFNNCTERQISLEEIKKAIILSDALNEYYPGPTELSNTDLDEIVGLDINELYREYNRALKRGRENNFCKEHIKELAAIDAFTLFSCRTVSNNLKNTIENRLAEIISSEGIIITVWPNVTINEFETFAIVGTNRGYIRYNLEGPVIDRVRNAYLFLNSQYNTAISNINGTSPYFDNAFVYNGVNSKTGMSVYLSFGDSERKDNLSEAMTLSDIISNPESIEISKVGATTINFSEPPKLTKEFE